MPATAAFPYLTALVLVPAGAALVVLALPRSARAAIRAVALAGSLGVLGVAAAVLAEFKVGVAGYQLATFHEWVPALGISWNLGIDGISLFLVVLTAALFPLVLLGAAEREEPKAFAFWLLVLEAGCLGSFLSLDLLFFYLFFETTLVPVYFLIAGWGHERRAYAATKFFLYTFGASLLMLVGIVALVVVHEHQTGVTTFDSLALASTHLSGAAGVLLFLAFTAAFAVKAPVVPFHTWQPDAYREAPVSATVLLAAVMAKLGAYGMVRFDLGLFPHASRVVAPVLLVLGVVGILYGGVVAAAQRDLKRLVAYSSIAHLGFIVLGLFALTGTSVSGAVLEMLNHGVYTAALFLCVGMIFRRAGTFSMRSLGGGVQKVAPAFAGVFLLSALAAIGVPGLNGFVSEFLILLGVFQVHRYYAVAAVVGVVVAAVYLLWAYQQVFHGPRPAVVEAPGAAPARFRELTWREGLVLLPLLGAIVFLGVYPKPVLDRITPSVSRVVAHVQAAAPATARTPVATGGSRKEAAR
ncbi:MAG TPA: NADH-quinone oxidoreductase subunit M [Acidimicrobiales bacterium]|nr:NADH-quinone oxidoreductase subunit M [Acidimicrobiales bacterium]